MGMQSDIFAEEMRGEIAAVDGIELGEATEVPGFRGWFLGLSLTAKSKLSTGITVVGMTLLATAGLVGIFNPGLSGVMATIIVVILAVTLIAGFVSLQMILKEVIAPFTHVASEMGRLAGGARDIDVGDTTRPDEIGDLSRALSIFAKSGIKLDELFAGRRTALERRKHELMLLADRFAAALAAAPVVSCEVPLPPTMPQPKLSTSGLPIPIPFASDGPLFGPAMRPEVTGRRPASSSSFFCTSNSANFAN